MHVLAKTVHFTVLVGLCSTSGNYVINAINCYSGGMLKITKGTSRDQSALTVAGSNSTRTNCYYLDGIQGTTGITVRTGETVFYKTLEGLELPENEENYPATTQTLIDTFNEYIESNPEGVSTVGWCKWIEGENNLPALDFTQEWNGTDWVTVN